jgi:hypothetical protein
MQPIAMHLRLRRVLIALIATPGCSGFDMGWGATGVCEVGGLSVAYDGPTDKMAGTWGQMQSRVSISDVALVGRVTTTTTALYRVVITGVASPFSLSVETCSVENESDNAMAQSRMSVGFVPALPVLQRTLTLETCGEDGLRIHVPRMVVVEGATLTDPENDALPTEGDDPRVVDFDGDGQPGFTVQVSGMVEGDMYVVQREWSEWIGVVTGRNTFDGTVLWGQEQSVVGASTWFLSGQTPTTTDADPAKNRFWTTRVDDDADCAAIIADRVDLFAR